MADLIVEREAGLVVIRLNRPERLNAISGQMLETFASEIPKLAADPSVRAILLTGTGRAFCAGGDVSTMQRKSEGGSTESAMTRAHGWVKALRSSHAVVVSAVNGVAAGGGFGLAMLGDVVLASSAAFFKAGFADLGVTADYGLAFTLPRAVGAVRAAEILFSDRRVPAEEAERLGFVGRLIPAEGFEDEALAFARKLAAGAFSAKLTKALLRHEEAEAFARFLAEEAKAQALAFQSEDFAEGAAAFMAKRPAQFHGR